MLKGIFEQLAEGHQLPKKLAQDLLSGMVDSVTRHLKQGDRIRISGLGTLEVRKLRRTRDATRPQARLCKLPPARRLLSVLPRN
jgi:DNA-binding protein HU-beta